MIRHSSSFFISIILHISILLALFYSYKNIAHTEKKEETRVQINLCNFAPHKEKIIEKKAISKKENVKPIKKIQKKPQEKKKIPKKTVPVKKEKIIPKKKVIKKTPPKPIEKKIEIEKPIPEPEIKNTPVIKEEVPKKEIIQKEKEILPPKEEAIDNETLQQNNSMQLEKEYLNKHIQKISQLLRDNLYYPRSARKRGITDSFTVKIKLLTSGKVDSIEVIDAKHKILSRAATKTITNIADKFPKPNQELVIHIPINYSLRR